MRLAENLVIVGVGLIGGSIGLAARKKGLAGRIIGVGGPDVMRSFQAPGEAWGRPAHALDLGTHQLRLRGAPVRLERRPFQLLALLVARHGRLVTREEIIQSLWPARIVIEFDSSINTLVRKVRHALGDSPEAPVFIETVAGLGYRFVAPIDQIPAPAPAASPGTGSPGVQSRRIAIGRYRRAAVAAGIRVQPVRARVHRQPVRPVRPHPRVGEADRDRRPRRARAGGRELPRARVDLRLAREARPAHRHFAGRGGGPRAREGGPQRTVAAGGGEAELC